MRVLFALWLLILASPAPAEPPAWKPGMPWQPTAPYVVIGQDEPGYRNWYIASPAHPAAVRQFNDYLVAWGVGGVVPTWQLLRTASDWYKCGAAPFEVPPPQEWPHLVQTLRYVRDKVIPAVGAVEPVSVYRNPALNQCAGGAQESAHRFMQAVDMVPLQPVMRDELIRRLCAVHAQSGMSYGVGLGFYVGLRFHVDSRKFRTWGVNDQGTVACVRSLELARSSDPDAPAAHPPSAGTPPEAKDPAQAMRPPKQSPRL